MRYPYPTEKTIGKDKFGAKILIVNYLDGGKQYYDLSTNGQRILLTPALARRLAKALASWAEARTK